VGIFKLIVVARRFVKEHSTGSLALVRAAFERRPVRVGSNLGLIAFVLLLPTLITDPFWQSAMTEQIGIYVLLAMGLNVVVGFAGLLDSLGTWPST
jgi:branched-chain amino acid transport system permease protein